MKKRIPHESPEPISVETLYKDHSSFVASFLSRLGVATADVADLVQEVFLVAHRKGAFVPGKAKARTWLSAIAFRVASGQRRKKSPELDAPDAATVANPELELQAKQALARVEACLDALDLAHRAVFVLFEIEGVSGVEIAETLKIPVGTVYRRLHEARATFRETHDALTGDKP